MQYLVSTTGTDVLVADLGVFIIHPTVNRDLALEFSPEEIAESSDLTGYISAGTLVLTLETNEYGLYEVDQANYNPYSLLQQNLPPQSVEDNVTETELASTFASTQIFEGVFPVAISSTTAVTNVIVSNSANFKDWKLSSGDIIYIYGNGANDGYKTVQSVISQKIFTTVEALTTTINIGSLFALNPSGATKIGVNTNNFSLLTKDVAQELFEEIDFQLSSISPGAHDDLETLVHELSENFDGYETRDADGVVTQIEFKNSLSGILIRSADSFTCNSDGLVTGFNIKQYNNSGSIVQTLTVTVNPITGTHHVVKT